MNLAIALGIRTAGSSLCRREWAALSSGILSSFSGGGCARPGSSAAVLSRPRGGARWYRKPRQRSHPDGASSTSWTAIERDRRRSGQPRSGDRAQYRAARRANRNSGLILLRSGRTSHGVLAVIVTQRQDLDTDVGAMRRQLAPQYQPDLPSVEVPGRVLRRVESELDDAMGCRRVNIVVRRHPPQLGRSLKSIRDRSDPRQVLVLAQFGRPGPGRLIAPVHRAPATGTTTAPRGTTGRHDRRTRGRPPAPRQRSSQITPFGRGSEDPG
jgi:hypothetical protein